MALCPRDDDFYYWLCRNYFGRKDAGGYHHRCVVSLIDIAVLRKTWRYAKSDFANAHHLEDCIYISVSQHDRIAHVLLLCSAINEIDATALDVLESINEQLRQQGVQLNFAEIKGPVMDAAQAVGFSRSYFRAGVFNPI